MKRTSIKDFIREEIEAILREKKVKFKRKTSIKETESTANAQDDQKVAQLAAVNAELDKEATLELKMINEKILPESLSATQIETIIKLIN